MITLIEFKKSDFFSHFSKFQKVQNLLKSVHLKNIKQQLFKYIGELQDFSP